MTNRLWLNLVGHRPTPKGTHLAAAISVATLLFACSDGKLHTYIAANQSGGGAGSSGGSGGSNAGSGSGGSSPDAPSPDASVSEPEQIPDAGPPAPAFDAGDLLEVPLSLVDMGTFGLARLVPETDPNAYQTMHLGDPDDVPAGIGKMAYWAGTQSGPYGTLRSHTERRPYFMYDVSGVQNVQRAVLRLWAYQEQDFVNGYGAFASDDSSETLTFFSVENTSVQDIQTSPRIGGLIEDPEIRAAQRAIFEDLGNGLELGSRVFTAQDNEPVEQNPARPNCQGVEACEKALTQFDNEGRPACGEHDASCGRWIELELNATAVEQINQGNATWVFGAALTSLNSERHANSTLIVSEWLFPNVRVDLNPERVPELVANGMAPPAPELLVYVTPSDPCLLESCDAGVCNSQPRCEDNNPCTVDSCSSDGECSHEPLSNGISCGLQAVCVDNQCIPGCSIDAECDDVNLCNGVELCNSATFQCVPGTAVACDNANVCDGAESCDPATGQCLPGAALQCPDAAVCNAGSCDPVTGCATQPVADGLACGEGRVCRAGACSLGCAQPGGVCDDGNPCTEGDICRADFSCQPGAARQCPNSDTCNVGRCDPAIGCTVEPAADGLTCAADRVCLAGLCSTGCSQPGGACDDGNPCTVSDICDANFSCRAGAAIACLDDGNPCTVESCDVVVGCRSIAVPPGTACGEASVCNGLAQCELALSSELVPLSDVGTFGLGTFVPSIGADSFQTLHIGDDSGREAAFGKMAYWAGTQSGPSPFPGSRIHTNRRPYFMFDVSGVSRATSARLRLWSFQVQDFTNGVGGFVSPDAAETLTLFSVDRTLPSEITSSPRIAAWNSDPVVSAAQRGIYEDLGDGTILGSRIFSAADNEPLEQNPQRPDCQGVQECLDILARLDAEGRPACGSNNASCGRWIELELNAAAIEQINQGTGTWLLGGDLTTINEEIHASAEGVVNEWVFANARVDMNPHRVPGLVASGMAPPAPELVVEVTSGGVVSCSSDSDCDDANPCNGSEACDSALGCVSGVALQCDDGNACNGTETCDATLGCSPGTALTCDDTNVCNGTESCDALLGCVAGDNLDCADDGNACNGLELCDTALGCIVSDALNCNFSNECGVGSCAAGLGCVVDAQPDGTLCAEGEGQCSAGECQPLCEVGEVRTEVSLDCSSENRGSFHAIAAMPFVVNSPWKHASNHQIRWTGTCVGETCATPNGVLEANRQYQTWDLARLDEVLFESDAAFIAGSGRVISAYLVMPHANNSYVDSGNGATETIQFYDVDTPASTLKNPDPDGCACLESPRTEAVVPPIFEDLGSGVVYGSVTLDASVNSTDGPEIPLNAAAVEAINSSRGQRWSIGGALVSGGDTTEFGDVERVWRGGGPASTLNMTLCVPAP